MLGPCQEPSFIGGGELLLSAVQTGVDFTLFQDLGEQGPATLPIPKQVAGTLCFQLPTSPGSLQSYTDSMLTVPCMELGRTPWTVGCCVLLAQKYLATGVAILLPCACQK